ncbi:PEP-CTERM-box response regulator transcription factor [candidate division KSB1 bacterium]|nr:PEP-CTERM-box response regulator transcription factor [candidate division KSB1 bacterium]
MSTAKPTDQKETILIVDDEEGIRTQIKWALANEYQVITASNIDEAISSFENSFPHLVTLDISLTENGDREGLEILEKIMKMRPKTKVIMITGHDEKEMALKAIQLGAFDFYQKPIEIDELKVIIKRALYIQTLEKENEHLNAQVRNEKGFADIIGDCAQMNAVYDVMRKVLSTDVPVLIYGESGTGKELVARAIHYQSYRKNKAFIPINCGAIPENLLESELFGHEKGSFTGAYYKKEGKFELADQGTAFLDEIGELSPTLQVKLLRFLQEKEIERVGGKQPLTVDVRIVAATNKDLEKEIKTGNFRTDLYYRLGVITIKLPPLRERGDDIILLASNFLNKYAKEYNKNSLYFEALAQKRMLEYAWPGNVRELENRIKRAAIMTQSNFVSCEDLGLDENASAKRETLVEIVDDVQKQYIIKALSKTNGNISKAARELGISRVTMYDLMNKLKVEVNKYRKNPAIQ